MARQPVDADPKPSAENVEAGNSDVAQKADASETFLESIYDDYVKPAVNAVVENPTESAIVATTTVGLVLASRGKALQRAPRQLDYNPMRPVTRDIVPFAGKANGGGSWSSGVADTVNRFRASLNRMTGGDRSVAFVNEAGHTSFYRPILDVPFANKAANYYHKGSDAVASMGRDGMQAVTRGTDFLKNTDTYKRARHLYRTGDMGAYSPSNVYNRGMDYVRNMDLKNPVSKPVG